MALRKFAYLSPSKVEGETSLPWEFIMTIQHSGKFGTGLTMSVLQEECCSVVQSCLIPCDPMDCSMPGFPVLYHLLKLAQTHVHWVNDAIQSSLPLLSPSPPAFYLSQNQDLFQWVSSSHQVAKVLELQLQNQSFQWIFRVDFLAVQGTLKTLLQHHSLKASILQCLTFFMVQLSHPYMTTGKTIALTRQIFGSKVK